MRSLGRQSLRHGSGLRAQMAPETGRRTARRTDIDYRGQSRLAGADRIVLSIFVSCVTLAGVALAALGARLWSAEPLEALLALALLAALAERFDLSLYGDSRVSVSFVPMFSAVLLAGLPGLLLVVPSAVIASALGAGRPLHKTLFNFGTLMLAGAASALVFGGLSAGEPASQWPQVLGPAVVAAAAHFLVNGLLVAAAIAFESRSGISSVWKEHFLWLWPHYLVLGVLALAIAAAYAVMGLWGVAVFLAPAVMMRFSLKQYLDRTTRNVLELRTANDDLRAAHVQVTAAMAGLGRAYDGTLRSLVAALDARDSETAGHSERVADLTMAIATEMGIEQDTEQWRHLSWGALLHDVGKIAIPDAILRKPSRLTEEEWEAMRTHPHAGHEILQGVDFLAPAAHIVLAHHERFDGTGYPNRLVGEEIPLGARIFMIADAFDAMTSERTYRRAMPAEEALVEILRNSGSQFDPAAVSAFLGVYQKRFVGSERARLHGRQLSDSLKKAIVEAAGLEKGL